MTFVVCEPCIGTKDHACVDVCPVDCFYEGAEIILIHPEECIDCGACVPECPVEAIYPEDEVPDDKKEWTEINAKKSPDLPVITDFFLGDPAWIWRRDVSVFG